jgi:hypothetical protein
MKQAPGGLYTPAGVCVWVAHTLTLTLALTFGHSQDLYFLSVLFIDPQLKDQEEAFLSDLLYLFMSPWFCVPKMST